MSLIERVPVHPPPAEADLARDRGRARRRGVDLQPLRRHPRRHPGDLRLRRLDARRRRRLRRHLSPADRDRAGADDRRLPALAGDRLRARADRQRAGADLRRQQGPGRRAQGRRLRQHRGLSRRRLQPAAVARLARPARRVLLDLPDLHRPAGADALPAREGRRLHRRRRRLRHRRDDRARRGVVALRQPRADGARHVRRRARPGCPARPAAATSRSRRPTARP